MSVVNIYQFCTGGVEYYTTHPVSFSTNKISSLIELLEIFLNQEKREFNREKLKGALEYEEYHLYI